MKGGHLPLSSVSSKHIITPSYGVIILTSALLEQYNGSSLTNTRKTVLKTFFSLASQPLAYFYNGNEITPKTSCSTSQLQLLLSLLLRKTSQHLSPLPENVPYSMKGSKATKQVLFQLLLLSPQFKAHSMFRTKLLSTALGQSIFSLAICCSAMHS